MKATIKQISKITGFSIATVSKVLNERPGISTSTRIKIRNAAEELNYFPYCKPRALGLSQRMFKYIGILTTVYEYYLRSPIETGIEKILSMHGYHLLKLTFNEKDNNLLNKELFFQKIVDDKSIAGLISIALGLSDKTIEELNKNNIPVVLVDKYTDFGKCVVIDNMKSTNHITKRLISLGHKHIGFISPEPVGHDIWYERITGYKKALTEKGIAYSPRLIKYENTFDMELVEIATKNLLEKVHNLTAIIFTSDRMAIAGMKAIRNYGLKIPDDISVVGFDNIEFDKYLIPPLSSVKQPAYEMGSKAAKILLDAIKEKDYKHEVFRFNTELIIRGSIRGSKSDKRRG